MDNESVGTVPVVLPGQKKRRVGIQFAWISIGRIAAAVIQGVLFILVARQVSPEIFGIFSTVYGIIVVAQSLMDLGISTLVIRERAANPNSFLTRDALRAINLTSSVLMLALLVCLTVFGIYSRPEYLQLIPLAIWAAAEKNVEGWLGIRLADGDAHFNSWALISRRLGSFLLFLVLMALDVNPLLAFSVSTAATSVVAAVIVQRLTKKVLPPIQSGSSFFSICKRSWHYWLNSFGTQIRNFDNLVVSVVAGHEAAGLYGAASRITGPLRILSTSLASVLLPAVSASKQNELKRLVRPVVFLIIGISFFYATVIVILPWAVPMALGEEYVGAVLPMQIVLAGLVFGAIASLLSSILQGLSMQKYVARVSLFTSLLCLALIGVLSYPYQAVGAAFGLSLSFLVQLLGLTYFFRKSIKDRSGIRL